MERHAIGAPQGGVVSPILSNIYLHKLDDFAGNTLIPEYTRGETRTRNKEYERVRHALARARKKGDHQKTRELRRRQARLPSVDCADPVTADSITFATPTTRSSGSPDQEPRPRRSNSG